MIILCFTALLFKDRCPVSLKIVNCFPPFDQNESTAHENYAPMKLTSEQGRRFSEPVTVPGTPVVFERAYVLQKIKGKLNSLQYRLALHICSILSIGIP